MKFFIYFVVFFGISFGHAYGYEEIVTSNFKVVNTLGEEIKSPLVEQQLNLQTSLTNVSDREIDWAYIVQIINSEGAIVDLNFSTGSLVKNQTLTPALFWTPHNGGIYKIEIFVWDNLRNINALSPKSTFTITVT
jgi:hypothetical protein